MPKNDLSLSAEDVGLGWVEDLEEYSGVLRAFGSSPAGFVLGAVLADLLGGAETLLEALLDGIQTLFVGSDGTISKSGTLGLADLPVLWAAQLGGTLTRLIGAATAVVQRLTTIGIRTAEAAGPFAPFIYAGEIAILLVVTAWLLRTLLAIGVDFFTDLLPGSGGLFK